MTIRAEDIGSVTVRTLLAEPLRVPAYQRPYSWRVETALQLLDDVLAVARPGTVDGRSEQVPGTPYVLGAVILHRNGEHLDIVDGQQRILTLQMLVRLLEGTALLGDDADQDSAVARVFNALGSRVGTFPPDTRGEVLTVLLDRCVLVRIVTDDIDEAFRVFDSQNYRGRSLAPHDLLKAHHLREMRHEPQAMQQAVVEQWESAEDEELDRLFSTYLYRIVKWSRGERAGSFTTHDIDAFKGISMRADLTPAARYHVAAQLATPLLRDPGPVRDARSRRLLDHARFQIDAPVVSGTPFFEMTAFFLAELAAARSEAYAEEWEQFASAPVGPSSAPAGRARYRLVSELYLAAVLYFTNRFGFPDEADRQTLFIWAYILRLTHQRVQVASVDRRASGQADDDAGLFVHIRTAPSRASALRAARGETVLDAAHDPELVTLLQKLRQA